MTLRSKTRTGTLPNAAFHAVLPALAALVLAGCTYTSTGSGTSSDSALTQQQQPQPANASAQYSSKSTTGESVLKRSGPQGLSLDDAKTTGVASYYGSDFAGNLTANGERFDPSKLTAAHRTLPFGTRVLVTNLKNGQHVTVRINDRGPFVDSRIIDLSRGAAKRLNMLHEGTAKVRLQILSRGSSE